MGIYTRTGDDGTTSLFGGARVRKDDPRVAAYGTVDELNAWLGLAAGEAGDEFRGLLQEVQSHLFTLGARLAAQDAAARDRTPWDVRAATAALEAQIDAFEAELPPLHSFILPGGSRIASLLHGARTVCRRAERETLAAPHLPEDLKYLNRLSDWLFVLARAANHRAGEPDIPWSSQDRTPKSKPKE